jgi:hypothetical protein
MDADFDVYDCNARIRASTCGTACEKTLHIEVKSMEMTIDSARQVAKAINDAANWLEHENLNPYDPDCIGCPGISECPHKKEKETIAQEIH